ncbi:MAG: hypothetical protein AB8C46_02870 [Burkholderiaceae bacterium]
MVSPGPAIIASPASRKLAICITLIGCLLVSACGGGGGRVDPECKRGLITGFGGAITDQTFSQVPFEEGQGGDGEGDGSVGGGEGVGVGGSDGQYTNVDVTIELTSGTKFGPWRVDDVKGMVTYVHCGGVLPAKITFEGKTADALYYDEGLRRDVSFAGKTRIGLITSHEKNVGVTALSHALYERAQAIGKAQGRDDGWKDLAIIEQAHRELLKVINDQLPGFYRLEDLRRLPVMLNARNDQPGSGTLTANQNGTYGALVAGLNMAGATALPDSTEPALDMAETIIADLSDGELDAIGPGGQSTNTVRQTPYQFNSLWSAWTTATGESAVRNGQDELATNVVPIGVVRSRAVQGQGGAVSETEYVLASNGKLIANLNPSVNGGQNTRPGQDRVYAQLYRFGVEPVIALRRDGQGVLVFPTSWDGSFFFEVAPPSPTVRMLELIDAGFPVIRMSDGSLYRLQGRTLSPEPTPVGILNYTCRAEFGGALANAGDARLGASNGRVCYGTNVNNQSVIWRPGTGAAGLPLGDQLTKQISGNEQITLGLLADGSLLHLDHDHSVIFRDAGGNPVENLQGGETRELIAPGSAPIQIEAPKLCWARAPFVIDCDGTAYAVEYREYLDTQGNFVGAGPITGLRRLPIPAPVWRTRSNQKVTAGDVRLGSDSVFIGTDNRIYEENGQPISLPVDGAPVEQPNQPPPAPSVAAIAGDDTVSRAEANQPLVVNGLAQPASTVTVTLGGQQQQATSDGSGQWSVTFAPNQLPQADGNVVLSAVATNGNGDSVATTRVLRFVLAVPARPTIAAVTGDNRVTPAEASGGVSIEGTGTAGATLQLDWSGQSKSTTIDPNGRWSMTFAAGEVPQPGNSRVTATPSNLNGTGEAASLDVTVLPPQPSVAIGAVTGDNILTGPETQNPGAVSGMARGGARVAEKRAGARKEATADSGGNWSVTYAPNELPQPGRRVVSAVASNAGGSSDRAEVAVQIEAFVPPGPATPSIAAVTGDNVVSPQEANSGVTITGTADPGVSLEINWGQIEKSVDSDGSGAWQAVYSSNEIPSPGTTTVTAQAFSSVGSSGVASLSVQVQALPPLAQPQINAVASDDVVDDREASSGVGISGTGTPGSEIRVSWNGATTSPATVNSSGNWSVTFSPGSYPSPGQTTVSATANLAGRNSAAGTRPVLLLDPSGNPSIDVIAGDDVVTLNEALQANQWRLPLSGTGRPRQAIRVFFSNGRDNEQLTATVSSAGRWSVTVTRPDVFSRDGPGSVVVDYGPGSNFVGRRSFRFSGFTLL